jgi:hypothetical protein
VAVAEHRSAFGADTFGRIAERIAGRDRQADLTREIHGLLTRS